jgi:Arc/MetJ-type ribon-helix-helix transcriptional regulator
MHISLTPKLENAVKRKVASGLYNNASEVIREACDNLSTGSKKTNGSQAKPPSASPNSNQAKSLKSILRRISRTWFGARHETRSH